MIELLVSLAILGMMSVLLVQGLHGGRDVWRRVEARAHMNDTVLTAQVRLAALLRGAIPETSFAGSQPFTRFEGASDTLRFLADPGDGSGGIQAMTLALAADGRLMLERRPDLAVALKAPPVAAAALIGGADRIEFEYFGAAPPDNERRWRTLWDDQAGLPELIRLRLAFAPGDPRRWPDLVVHPAATIDTACVFVPATGRCKGRS